MDLEYKKEYEKFFERLKTFKLSGNLDSGEGKWLKEWFDSHITRLDNLSEEDKLEDDRYRDPERDDEYDQSVASILPLIRSTYRSELKQGFDWLDGLMFNFILEKTKTNAQKSFVRNEFITFLEKKFKQEGGRNKRSKHRKMRKTRKSLIRRRR